MPGLLRGASRGAVGALVQPLAFALETSVAVADSLRSAIMGIPPLLPRARPPRHVASDEPLAVYNWSEVGKFAVNSCSSLTLTTVASFCKPCHSSLSLNLLQNKAGVEVANLLPELIIPVERQSVDKDG